MTIAGALRPSKSCLSTFTISGGRAALGVILAVTTNKAEASTNADASTSLRTTRCSPWERVIRIPLRWIPT